MPTSLLISAALGLTSGIGIRSFFIFDLGLVVVICVCGAVGVLVVSSRYSRTRSFALCVVVALVFFCIGVFRFAQVEEGYDARMHAYAPYEERAVTLHGVISRDVERRDGGRVVYVKVVQIGDTSLPPTTVRVSADVGPALSYADAVVVIGVLRVPQEFETDSERTFRYQEYLRAHGVTHTLSYAEIREDTRSTRLTLWEKLCSVLFAIKHAIIVGIERALPEPQAGFAEGLLLGEKHALGAELEDVFRDVGIIHIIVLSGYNLTIVAECVMRLFSKIFYPRTRALVGVVVITLFACMVGLSATVVRASLMGMLVLCARAFGKTYDITRALAVVAALMIVVSPYALMFDTGFQLSFLATLGLIYIAPLLERVSGALPTTLQLREYVTATLATQLFVTPYLLFSMGSLSLIALVANVLILVVVPFAMFSALCAGIAGILFSQTSLMIGFPAYVTLSYIIGIAEYLSRLPFATIAAPSFSWQALVGMYVLLGSAVYVWSKKLRTSHDATVTA